MVDIFGTEYCFAGCVTSETNVFVTDEQVLPLLVLYRVEQLVVTTGFFGGGMGVHMGFEGHEEVILIVTGVPLTNVVLKKQSVMVEQVVRVFGIHGVEVLHLTTGLVGVDKHDVFDDVEKQLAGVVVMTLVLLYSSSGHPRARTAGLLPRRCQSLAVDVMGSYQSEDSPEA